MKHNEMLENSPPNRGKCDLQTTRCIHYV